MSDNVIKFPKNNKVSEQQTEEIDKDLILANEISEFIWNDVMAKLSKLGCDIETDMDKKLPSMILILESIKSFYLQTKNIEHYLQEFSTESFIITPKNQEKEKIRYIDEFFREIEEQVDNDKDR